MGVSDMGIIQVLLPAVMLHGMFDFFLFLTGAIQAAWQVRRNKPLLYGLGGICIFRCIYFIFATHCCFTCILICFYLLS
jgi:hypothetical protein